MKEFERELFLHKVHSATALDPHLLAQFSELKIGSTEFLAMARQCLHGTGTPLPNWKAFQRLDRLWKLLCYMRYAQGRTSEGRFCECGVFLGFSALAMSKVMTDEEKTFPSRELWLIDSFEGLSEPSDQDRVDHNGTPVTTPSMVKGHFAVPLEYVQQRLGSFSNIRLQKGWIPEVFASLPDGKWAFVHIDVDLYEPILASLEYFYPRLVPSAVVINDDFGSNLYPGAAKAWVEFFQRVGKGYAVLDSGQAVYIHN